MTALTDDLTLTGEIVLLDEPPKVGEFYHLDDEVIEVSGSVTLNYSDAVQHNRWRVRRAQDHTTAATHSSGAALTVAREFGGEAGAGGVPDPTGAPDGQVPTTAAGEYALSSENGGITARDPVSGAEGSLVIQAPNDNGLASAGLNATDANDAGATTFLEATTEGGAALVSAKATATAVGTATARLDAESVGGFGDSEARVAIVAAGAPQVGVVASSEAGVGLKLLVYDGQGQTGVPGDVLNASATSGSEWLPKPQAAFVDPTTATAEDIANALIAAGLMAAS